MAPVEEFSLDDVDLNLFEVDLTELKDDDSTEKPVSSPTGIALPVALALVVLFLAIFAMGLVCGRVWQLERLKDTMARNQEKDEMDYLVPDDDISWNLPTLS